MKILVINSGSSTLKFDMIEVQDHATEINHEGSLRGQSAISGAPVLDNPQLKRLAHGIVDRIGGDATFEMHSDDASRSVDRHNVSAPGHREAVALALRALPGGGIDAVGHRVVHGGDRFVAPTLIDEAVVQAIEELCELAPLHNPAALDGIKAARQALGTSVPMVAVFDTAFHSTLPDYAYDYALPYDLAHKHKVRRYGFHGIAHQYMLEQYALLKGISPAEANIITFQLGNGCSAAAIQGGKSVDTSMGFTPLEGLVMGTRSGDLDPSVLNYLSEKEGVSTGTVEEWLNKRSGLLGLSGSTNDMRALLDASSRGDERAKLAVQVFCYRARKYIGAYLAAIGGAKAVVFGGGIGENSPVIREQILTGLEWVGLKVDKARNESVVGKTGEIGAEDSAIGICVIPVDEAQVIARQTASVVENHPAK